jgi:hypothetical protein
MNFETFAAQNPDVRIFGIIANSYSHSIMMSEAEFKSLTSKVRKPKPTEYKAAIAKATSLSNRLMSGKLLSSAVEKTHKDLIVAILAIVLFEHESIKAGGNPSPFTIRDITDNVVSHLHARRGMLN